MRCLAPIVVLLAASSTLAQEVGASEWDALVVQLGDPMKRDFAIAAMDRLGPTSVQRLLDAIDVDEPVAARGALYAISELAHHVEPHLAALVEKREQCSDGLLPEFLEAQFRAGPYLPARPGRASSLEAMAIASREMKATTGDAQLRFAVVYWSLSQLDLDHPLGIDSNTDELVRSLRPKHRRHQQARAETAAKVLALRGDSAIPAIPALMEWIRDPIPAFTSSTSWAGGKVAYPAALPSSRWFALAVVQIAQGSTEALEAHGYLARHGNPLDFKQAMEAIRLHAAKAGGAVPHLVAVLQGDDAKERTTAQVREAIITLGVLGKSAEPAAAVLESLADGDDKTTAKLAQAALRSIRSKY